jgi:hypothetical protein
MKRILLFWLFINSCFSVLYAQQQMDLKANYKHLQQRERSAMLSLGTWAIGNIALGSVLAAKAKNEENKAFFQMNAGWNIVNLAIAGAGFYSAQKGIPDALTQWDIVEKHYSLQKTFLFNAGLDVGYMAGGAWLMERSKTTLKKPEQTRGFGKAIILQGGFLFVFDLAQFFIVKSDNPSVKNVFKELSFSANSVSFLHHF